MSEWYDKFSGTFATKGTVADRIHTARSVMGMAEDEIDDVLIDEWGWEDIDRLSFDYYDNSMEVYFGDSVSDLEATEEQQAKFWEFGFVRCWLNFKGGIRKGGTERFYMSPELRARIASRDVAA